MTTRPKCEKVTVKILPGSCRCGAAMWFLCGCRGFVGKWECTAWDDVAGVPDPYDLAYILEQERSLHPEGFDYVCGGYDSAHEREVLARCRGELAALRFFQSASAS